MRKRFLTLGLVLCLSASLCACGKKENKSEPLPSAPIDDVTTENPYAIDSDDNTTTENVGEKDEPIEKPSVVENASVSTTIVNSEKTITAKITSPYSFKVKENKGSYIEFQDAYYNLLDYELLSSTFGDTETTDLIENYFSFVENDSDFVNPIVHSAYSTEIDGETIIYSTLNCTIYNMPVIQYVMAKKLTNGSYIVALYTDYNGGSYSEEEVFALLSDNYLNLSIDKASIDEDISIDNTVSLSNNNIASTMILSNVK